PGLWDTLDAWAKSQRRAPEAYTASDVVAPSVPAPISQSSSTLPERPVQNIDNRQFHIHGADPAKVKQIINEQMSTLIDHTTQDLRSAEL
ncbi:hypothetical protein C9975_07265, partial [Thalassospira xiamenensis]